MRIRLLGSLILWGASLASIHDAQSSRGVIVAPGMFGGISVPDFSCCGAGNKLTVVNQFGNTIAVSFNGSPPVNIKNGRKQSFDATASVTDFYNVIIQSSIFTGNEINNCKPGTSDVYNTPPVNPVILSSVAVPHTGKFWSVSLSCAGADPAKLAIFVLGIPSDPALTPFGVRLVSLVPGTYTCIAIPHAGGVVTPAVRIPNDPSLRCFSYRVQGMCGDAPKGYLSNALNEVIGN